MEVEESPSCNVQLLLTADVTEHVRVDVQTNIGHVVKVLASNQPDDLADLEILSKVVYAERAHPVEMISKVSLGGLLDLFLTVDEFDARYDFGEQFRTVEPAPVFLGFQAQFKDHGQCRDS